MSVDVSAFKGRVPCGSELYGVYQPLLGWKARRAVRRFSLGPRAFLDDILRRIRPRGSIEFLGHPLEFEVERFLAGDTEPRDRRDAPNSLNTFVGRLILPKMAKMEPDETDRRAEILRRQPEARVTTIDLPFDDRFGRSQLRSKFVFRTS